MKKILYYTLTLLLGLFLCSGNCNPTSVIPDPDPDPEIPEIPEIPIFGGNVGPRANDADDPTNGIYVSPSGSDASGTGTKTSPYKSISFALDKANPPATILLLTGTYKEGHDIRVRKSNITIKSAKGEWGVIDLTTYDSGHDQDSGIEFYQKDDDTGDVVTNCTLQHLEIKGGFYAVNCETTWEWGVEYYPLRKGVSDIIIEDCILHHTSNDVVKVKPGCKNITIRYNEIHHSGQEHISHPDFTKGERNAEGIDIVNGTNIHVHNNYIHDICSTGVYAKGGSTDAIIENNIIEHTYAAAIQVGFDTSPQYFDLSVNPKYYENINGIVRNNLTIDTGWEGIGLYASKDAQVYNNTVVNAVTYGTGKYHSPIYYGVATQDWANPAGCPPNVNPNIHHNIVSQPSSYPGPIIEIRYIVDFPFDEGYPPGDLSGLEGNPTMNYNCYYVAGNNATFRDMRPPEADNMSLATWKTHVSGESNSIEVNPTLGTDYMPTNTQCTGMGISVPLTK